MTKVGLFAYGEMGPFALKALITGSFDVPWIIIPPEDSDSQDSSLVETIANEKGVKIIRTNSNNEIYDLIISDMPDVIVISSYNKILSEKILSSTRFINIHHGDLPRFKGRANINWAIILGRKEIGLTFHEATPALDSGNIYVQYMVDIEEKDSVKTIYEKVNTIVEKDLAEVVTKVLDGYKGTKQEGEESYCCTRLPEDGLIDWNQTSKQIYDFIRALTKPYPGAFTFFEGKKLLIWTSEIPEKITKYEGRISGRIIQIHKDLGVEVLTGDSSILIKDVSFINEETQSASEVIRSVKKTLGINIVELYEQVQQLLKQK